MTVESFRDFWWTIFAVFGTVKAVLGRARDSTCHDQASCDAREELERKQ